MPPVPAVKRALSVLELLVHEREPLMLSDIVARTGIPTASCHAIMHTLQEAGYVSRRSEGRTQYWEPTLALFHLGSAVVSRFGIRDIAMPYLRELSAAFDVPAHLGVLVGTDVMYLEKAAAPSFIQFNTFPGKLSPFHITALGRAIAAWLPEAEQRTLTAALSPPIEGLLSETHAHGYAVEDSEEIDGVGCIAAPVFGADGTVVASVGLTGFSRDLLPGGDPPAVPAVLDAARAISAELGYRPASALPA
ncbi:IclR family transcriptional regulator [Conexibacter stalactiti]|uniref:IclR family transcriptional regulator n=1 Tax=Conexibacter stalactiti TaxID=1940611 RepID=A0ABU4HK66_9ACTN|nr:IclR family transcriptional regulator [Conexibacter stalactiti]MDW5593694.1 IclR family transcriptional regulator [Conexibacter stalactiti]MEC5034335.1 IclR family transcriptional regulator [Conexibacter stalactiti]